MIASTKISGKNKTTQPKRAPATVKLNEDVRKQATLPAQFQPHAMNSAVRLNLHSTNGELLPPPPTVNLKNYPGTRRWNGLKTFSVNCHFRKSAENARRKNEHWSLVKRNACRQNSTASCLKWKFETFLRWSNTLHGHLFNKKFCKKNFIVRKIAIKTTRRSQRGLVAGAARRRRIFLV